MVEITLISTYAFMLYTTLAGKTWFPVSVLAYLFALSEEYVDEEFSTCRSFQVELESIPEKINLFRTSGLFQILTNEE